MKAPWTTLATRNSQPSSASKPEPTRNGPIPGNDEAQAEAAPVSIPAQPDATESAPLIGVSGRRGALAKLVVYAVLPALALLIACGAGYLKWKGASVREADAAAVQAGQVAGSTSMTLLSYEPNTAEQNLSAARDLLTGTFKDSYTALTNDVVIPGAKEKQVSSRASIAAVARVSATPTHYVGLVFIDQTVVIGTGAPTVTASSVRVTLDKVGDRWLMSGFDPV